MFLLLLEGIMIATDGIFTGVKGIMQLQSFGVVSGRIRGVLCYKMKFFVIREVESPLNGGRGCQIIGGSKFNFDVFEEICKKALRLILALDICLGFGCFGLGFVLS
jgi:hypothetical protein